jgi:hypothetical protein
VISDGEPKRPTIETTIVQELAKMCRTYVKSEQSAYGRLLCRKGVPYSQAVDELEKHSKRVLGEVYRRKWSYGIDSISEFFDCESSPTIWWKSVKYTAKAHLIEIVEREILFTEMTSAAAIPELPKPSEVPQSKVAAVKTSFEHSDTSPEARPAESNSTPGGGGTATKPALSEDVPTVADIEAALNSDERKKAVQMRATLDECTVTELWTEAFGQRAGTDNTKRTAFNRWQASRPDTPSWADELIRERLLGAASVRYSIREGTRYMDSHGKEPTWFGRTLSGISAAITRFQGSLYQPPQTRIEDIDPGAWPSPLQPVTDSEAAEIERRTREARIRAHEEHAYTATLQGLGTNGPSGPQFGGNEDTQVNKQARHRIVNEADHYLNFGGFEESSNLPDSSFGIRSADCPALGEPRTEVATPGDVLPATDLKARRWEDIEIVFLSEFMVQIRINSQPQPPQNYAEMGFDNKTNEKPIAAWETLWELAQHGGVLRVAADSRKWGQIEKRMQEIRKAFRCRYALPGDPIPFSKKTPQNREDFGYHAKFRIRCHPASEA